MIQAFESGRKNNQTSPGARLGLAYAIRVECSGFRGVWVARMNSFHLPSAHNSLFYLRMFCLFFMTCKCFDYAILFELNTFRSFKPICKWLMWRQKDIPNQLIAAKKYHNAKESMHFLKLDTCPTIKPSRVNLFMVMEIRCDSVEVYKAGRIPMAEKLTELFQCMVRKEAIP